MKHDLKQIVGNTLRWGVSIACLIALIGGVLYLVQHGGEPMKDYSHFSYTDVHSADFTTLSGILDGLCHFTAVGWIQTGVLVLLLTPILRVAISMLDFLRERDWLYAVISAVVLAVIISNSLGGTT